MKTNKTTTALAGCMDTAFQSNQETQQIPLRRRLSLTLLPALTVQTTTALAGDIDTTKCSKFQPASILMKALHLQQCLLTCLQYELQRRQLVILIQRIIQSIQTCVFHYEGAPLILRLQLVILIQQICTSNFASMIKKALILRLYLQTL